MPQLDRVCKEKLRILLVCLSEVGRRVAKLRGPMRVWFSIEKREGGSVSRGGRQAFWKGCHLQSRAAHIGKYKSWVSFRIW